MLRSIAAATAVIFATVPAAAQLSLPELFKLTSPAVAKLEMSDAAGQLTGRGTGFLISDRAMVTNHHVVAGAASAAAVLADGRRVEVEGLLATDPVHDVAVVQLREAPGAVALRMARVLPEIGESVAVVGSPRGLEQTLSDGIVSAIREYGRYGSVIQTTAAISMGSSGSPILNRRGEVVGVVAFIRVDGQALNFGIPINRVTDLKLGAPSPLGDAGPAAAAILPAELLARVRPPLPEPPAGILDRLSDSHRELIRKQAAFHLLLPDGQVVNAYRAMRQWMQNGPDAPPLSSDEREALEMSRGSVGEEISVEGIPPERVYAGEGIVCLYAGDASPQDPEYVREGVALARMNGRLAVFIRPGLTPSEAAALPSAALLLWPAGDLEYEEQSIRVFEVFWLSECRASPEQLAYALLQGDGHLRVYTFAKSSFQPKRTISTGTGFSTGSSRVIYDGPRQTTYTWKHNDIKIMFREPRERSAAPPSRAEGRTPEERPAAPDQLRMTDGRVLSGRFVSEKDGTVTFVVVVGAIQQEMTFPRYQVAEIRRGP